MQKQTTEQERGCSRAELERLQGIIVFMEAASKAERDSLTAEIERLRTGRMLSIKELRAWREADHEDAIMLHRNCIIDILAEIEWLRRKVAEQQ